MKPLLARPPRCFGVALCLIGAIAAPGVAAHETWVEREGDEHRLLKGHLTHGDGGERRHPYAADYVKDARCFAADGREARARLVRGVPARLVGACAATLFSASGGYFTKTPRGTLNRPKNQVGDALVSWEALDTVKSLRVWTPALAVALGDVFELAPENDPFRLGADAALTVRVFWRGRPQGGVAVEELGGGRAVSGADGRVTLRLRRPGRQWLHAVFDQPPRDPARADKTVYATHLNFDLP